MDFAPGEDWLAVGRYDFGYAWLDGDPFLATSNFLGSLQRDLGAWGQSDGHVRVNLDQYFFESEDVPDASTPTCPNSAFPPMAPLALCSPEGIDERSARRRSGFGVGGGVGHRVVLDTGSLPVQDLWLRGSFEFEGFEARGREYSFHASTMRLELGAALPLDLTLDASGAFTYKPFRHPSTFPDPPIVAGTRYTLSNVRRREQVLQVETALSRPVTEHVSVSARWQYLDNQSNVRVFDYDHHVLGFTVNFAVGREL